MSHLNHNALPHACHSMREYDLIVPTQTADAAADAPHAPAAHHAPARALQHPLDGEPGGRLLRRRRTGRQARPGQPLPRQQQRWPPRPPRSPRPRRRDRQLRQPRSPALVLAAASPAPPPPPASPPSPAAAPQAAPLPLGGQPELLQAAAWTFGRRGTFWLPGSQVAPRLLRRSLQGFPGKDSSVKLM